VGRGLRDFFGGFLSALPYLALIALPVTAAVLLLLRRRRRKRQTKH
jgi:hypothetical protein